MPQPNFVPVSPSTSRRYHNRGMLGSPSKLRSIPFTLSFTIGVPFPHSDEHSMCHVAWKSLGNKTQGASQLGSAARRDLSPRVTAFRHPRRRIEHGRRTEAGKNQKKAYGEPEYAADQHKMAVSRRYTVSQKGKRLAAVQVGLICRHRPIRNGVPGTGASFDSCIASVL